MAAAAAETRRERARGVLAALEAALALEEEEGEVPAHVLVEHLKDTRRRQKLLLTQLRVLRRLLGLLDTPGPPPGPPDLRAAGAEARGRWRGLKSGYGGAVEALGGALPPALAQLGRGRCLLERGVGSPAGRPPQELEAKLREATGQREQLRRRLEDKRGERLGHQGALQRLRGAARRAGAGCRLYRTLTGVGPPRPSPTPGGEPGAATPPPPPPPTLGGAPVPH